MHAKLGRRGELRCILIAMRVMCFMKYRHSIQRFHRMFRLKLFHHFPLSSPDYPPTSLLITSHHFNFCYSLPKFLPSLVTFIPSNSFQQLSFLDKPSCLERKVQTDLSANYLRILVKGDLLLSLPEFECTPVPS